MAVDSVDTPSTGKLAEKVPFIWGYSPLVDASTVSTHFSKTLTILEIILAMARKNSFHSFVVFPVDTVDNTVKIAIQQVKHVSTGHAFSVDTPSTASA